jgi:hypothetical protein
VVPFLETIPGSGDMTVTALCAPGDIASGGGFTRSTPDVIIKDSYPLVPIPGSPAIGWLVVTTNPTPGDADVTSFAVCLAMAPP